MLVNDIAKWTGTEWEPLGSGLSDPFATLAVDAEDRLVAGGDFYGEDAHSYNLTRWDGAAWEILDYNGFVTALLVDGDTLYLGGFRVCKLQNEQFECLGSHFYNDQTLKTGYIHALTLDGQGRLVVAGQFTRVGETPVNNIARWDGARWQALGSGIEGPANPYIAKSPVNALITDDQGRVLAGGSFTQAGGKASSYLARWQDPFAVWLPDVFR